MLSAIITAFLNNLFLARKLEDYKSVIQLAINKELSDYQRINNEKLESHKSILQSGINKELSYYQKKNSEQLEIHKVRFSALHQKRAEVVEELFGMIARLQNDLLNLEHWESLSKNKSKKEFFENINTNFKSFTYFFDQKRIYFDDEIRKSVIDLVSAVQQFLNNYETRDGLQEPLPRILEDGFKITVKQIVNKNINPTIQQIESKFKELLSA